jgi:sulfatase maturation enzyme AslB (radical SAM superfamily)
MCSIDAIGSLNDYIRRPSKWAEIDRNLHQLDDHYQEWNLRKVHFNTTVQIYNVLNLAEFFDYLQTDFKHLDPVPQFTPLYGPSYLSIVNLPDPIKHIARQRLIEARDKAERRLGRTSKLSSVDTVLSHMEQNGHKMNMMDFLYFSEKTDREFNESWRKACPELEQLLTAR